MADTTFVNYQTPINADWLNDVNRLTYDLPSTASGKGASLVGVQDAGGYWDASTVEALGQEIGAALARNGSILTEYNLLRAVPPAQWANILAGTSTYDATAAVQAAISSGYPIFVPGIFAIYGQLDISNMSTMRGVGFNGGGTAGSGFVFYNLVGATPLPALKMTNTRAIAQQASVSDIFFKASSWNAVTGALGHGMDIASQISLTRVLVIGFGKIGIYLHHDALSNGPYECTFTNVRCQYNGQHGCVVGRGANSVSIINSEFKWNGAPSYLTAPTVAGSYDGLYVDNYDDGSGWPSYLPEGLCVIGGDASYNSRYGWNIQGLSYGRVMPGYAEFNKQGTYDANLGADLQNSTVIFGRIPLAKINLGASFASYQRTNHVIVGGQHVGSGNTNTAPQNSFFNKNQTVYFAEDPTLASSVTMIPDPATGNCTLRSNGTAVLTIGSGAATALPLNANVKFSGVNTTGAGSAALGANSPATVLTAPYTWVRVLAADGTTCFLPLWK